MPKEGCMVNLFEYFLFKILSEFFLVLGLDEGGGGSPKGVHLINQLWQSNRWFSWYFLDTSQFNYVSTQDSQSLQWYDCGHHFPASLGAKAILIMACFHWSVKKVVSLLYMEFPALVGYRSVRWMVCSLGLWYGCNIKPRYPTAVLSGCGFY